MIAIGERRFFVEDFSPNGFAIAEDAPHLPGHITLYDGTEPMGHGLVVCSSVNAGRAHYEFKRFTPYRPGPALDFPKA